MTPTPPHIPEHSGTGTLAIPASLRYHGLPATEAMLAVRRHGARARTLRAAKAWLACWGLAVVAVFLPVLHFVLVPSLLIAGPLLAMMRLREVHELAGAAAECPACHVRAEFTLSGAWRERVPLRCESCGRQLELELPAEPAGD